MGLEPELPFVQEKKYTQRGRAFEDVTVGDLSGSGTRTCPLPPQARRDMVLLPHIPGAWGLDPFHADLRLRGLTEAGTEPWMPPPLGYGKHSGG